MKNVLLPMTNYSTLIYFVNKFQSEENAGHLSQLDEFIDEFLESMPEEVEFEPSDKVIGNILNFARSYDVCKTENAGYVEMNLN